MVDIPITREPSLNKEREVLDTDNRSMLWEIDLVTTKEQQYFNRRILWEI